MSVEEMNMNKETAKQVINTPPPVSSRGFLMANDGKDHINISNNGNTQLGKLLSDYAYTPFRHPYFGPFDSLIGFMYWRTTGNQHDELRYLSGHRARTYGMSKAEQRIVDPHVHADIVAALYQKIIQFEGLKEMVVANSLPYDQYYEWGPMKMLVSPRNHKRIVAGMQEIATALKKGEQPRCWLDAERRYTHR